MRKVESDFLKDEETVQVSTRACARLLAVLEALGVCPHEAVNPVDAAAYILEGIVECRDRINAAAVKHDAESDIPNGGATSGCPDQSNQDASRTWKPEGWDVEAEPNEEELGELDEVTHEAYCRVWSTAEAREEDCDCGAGIPDDGHEYDHGGG